MKTGKVMDEYIKRGDAVAAIYDSNMKTPIDYIEGGNAILMVLAADVAPVRHGRWIGVRLGDMRCSLCGEIYDVCGGLLGDYNYCPN